MAGQNWTRRRERDASAKGYRELTRLPGIGEQNWGENGPKGVETGFKEAATRPDRRGMRLDDAPGRRRRAGFSSALQRKTERRRTRQLVASIAAVSCRS
ncbi:hypothetical protein PT2222_100250 [Paraburkholderia tropica]